MLRLTHIHNKNVSKVIFPELVFCKPKRDFVLHLIIEVRIILQNSKQSLIEIGVANLLKYKQKKISIAKSHKSTEKNSFKNKPSFLTKKITAGSH